MPRTLLFCDLDLKFQGHWWPLKRSEFGHFFTFWPSSHIQKLDHPMVGIYNTYIGPL